MTVVKKYEKKKCLSKNIRLKRDEKQKKYADSSSEVGDRKEN